MISAWVGKLVPTQAHFHRDIEGLLEFLRGLSLGLNRASNINSGEIDEG